MENQVQLRRAGDIRSSFVVKFFEEFYQQVVALTKEALLQTTSVESGIDKIPGDSDEAIQRKAQYMLNRLYETLESQALKAAQMGGDFAISYYREAQYVMAALADEIFLYLPWNGVDYWKDNLLESRLFGTHDAGDKFFDNLDRFMQLRDPLRTDVAEVYLLALGLGFLGKYRGRTDLKQLDLYRQQLYVFINHHEPRLYRGGERLFPDAYAHTLEEGRPRRFDDMRFWTGAIACVFGVLLLFSFITWQRLTSDLESTADSILSSKVSRF
jgi:type VI secretion system protein ImpK